MGRAVAEETDSEQRGPGGRPTKRTQETDAVVLRTLGMGLSYATAAAAIGVLPDTLRRWRREDEAFSADCERARAESITAPALKLWELAKSGDMDAIRFFLSRRSKDFHEKLSVADENDGEGRGVIRKVVVEVADHPEAKDEEATA